MFKRIFFVFLVVLAGVANAQVNKYAEVRGYGYSLDEQVLAEDSKSPVACDESVTTSLALNYTALYCANAKSSDLRIGIEWKRTSFKINDYAKHLGGTLLADANSPTEGYISWDVVNSFAVPAGVKGTLFDCTVKDNGKVYYLSFFLFSTKEDGRRNIVYVYSVVPDSKESETLVRTSVRNIAQTIRPVPDVR